MVELAQMNTRSMGPVGRAASPSLAGYHKAQFRHFDLPVTSSFSDHGQHVTTRTAVANR